jgi:pimeloyl-ACP methyl ester carboxylesterase
MLDTVMPGRAAVALGDLQTAHYVSILVPGALLSVREHMAEWTKVTADIYDEQTAWQKRFGSSKTVAAVSWIGYRTPDATNVAGLDLAHEGASFLSGTVNGLKSLRVGDEPYVSVFAHSYGATAAMLALDHGGMSVDALAMIGSPGGVADRADSLAVPAGHVWVGEAAWDPVVHTAFFGVDPGSREFGAKTMSVSGAVDPVTGAVLTASVGHDWYLEPGTESLRNLSLIGIDRGDWVTDGTADDSQKTLALGTESSSATR